MNKQILHLNLKKKWYDMIISGEKKEEYRTISEYWVSRFFYFKSEIEELDELTYNLSKLICHKNYDQLFKYFDIEFKNINIIRFSNGYRKDRPQFDIECRGITVGHGKPEWGAEPNENYFILKLEKILNGENNETNNSWSA